MIYQNFNATLTVFFMGPNKLLRESTVENEARERRGDAEMPSVAFLQYFGLYFDEIPQKSAGFTKNTVFFPLTGENTVFFHPKYFFFSPKNTANLFCKVGIPGDVESSE